MEFEVIESGQRLDVFVAEQFGIDRERARTWILAGQVQLVGDALKPSRILRSGMRVLVDPPQVAAPQASPEDLPLELVYEDEFLVVINKPADMVSHPGPGHWHGGVVNALLFHCQGWTGINGEATPGIVHRLDKPTTGLLIYAKTEAAHKRLHEMMRKREIHRRYWAIAQGELDGQGTINQPLQRSAEDPQRVEIHPDGKHAITHWQALGKANGKTSLELVLETGRTHQIRVHLASLDCPIWGDRQYGQEGPFMALHAAALAFTHPITGESLRFSAPPPAYWEAEFGDLFATFLARI